MLFKLVCYRVHTPENDPASSFPPQNTRIDVFALTALTSRSLCCCFGLRFLSASKKVYVGGLTVNNVFVPTYLSPCLYSRDAGRGCFLRGTKKQVGLDGRLASR